MPEQDKIREDANSELIVEVRGGLAEYRHAAADVQALFDRTLDESGAALRRSRAILARLECLRPDASFIARSPWPRSRL
jgi:hypothetical protein